MHYAIHHYTVSELIYEWVNSERKYLRLTSFKGEHPISNEAKVVKNYLTEQELRNLNLLVFGYLDFADKQIEKFKWLWWIALIMLIVF